MSEDWEVIDSEEMCESCQADEFYADEDCEECECGRKTRMCFDWKWEMDDRAGVFFTERACEFHIAQNHYHYNKPRSYVISAWRNPEMVETMQMILKLTGDDIPSCYS